MAQLLTAKWVLPISETPIKDGGVLIEGDKIAAVGPRDRLLADHPQAEHEDFGRAAIMPGFVDVHTHLEYTAFRGLCDDLPYTEWRIQLIKMGRALDFDDWIAAARLGAIEAARSGITTIADLSDRGGSLKAAKEVGLRGIFYVELMEMDHAKVNGVIETAKGKVEAWSEEADNDRMTIGIAPISPHSACPPLIAAASAWAAKDGLKVCTHLAGSHDEYEFIKYGSSALAGSYRDLMGWGDVLWQPTGASPVKYLLQWGFFENDVLAVHCVHVDDDDIDILAEHDVAIAHCPKCSAKLAMGTAPLRKFKDVGLRVGLGTDSPASNNTMDVFDEMRIGLLFQRARNCSINKAEAQEFVRMVTLGGAEALGLDHLIGSLETGKQADVVVVDLSHSHQRPLTDPFSALVYTANQEDIAMTMVDGREIFADGVATVVDEEDALARIEPVREKLR